jgi:flavin-dependent dehydrogenase
MALKVDVAIIGGGPAGSTAATILRKYNPKLSVLILEREKFPRDHVGESQLPLITKVLDEMGVWDKVEAARFPIKIGATYRWGSTQDLWNFDFLPEGKFDSVPRPSKLKGQRHATAFQIDRAVFDKILLDHAKTCGVQVREECRVMEVQRTGDRVDGLRLDTGEIVQADWYLDCSGHTAVLRRAMEVPIEVPTTLQNLAIWRYWRNTEWETSVGVGGTRILVMSLGYGWIWFIPIGPDRTSIGLVVPQRYFKEKDQTPEEMYHQALESEPLIGQLTANARVEEKLHITRDWNFVADRLVGENWFLIGESAGFADPILSAGMTLAHEGAREVAYTIMSMQKGEFETDWARQYYSENQIRRIRQHIRFADFWYTANESFTDLKEFTREIAQDAGLSLDAEMAWQWLGTGGFVDDQAGGAGVAAYNLVSVHHFAEAFTQGKIKWESAGKSRFVLNLEGAEKTWAAIYENGRITRYRCYVRDRRRLPSTEPYSWIITALKRKPTYESIVDTVEAVALERGFSQEAWQEMMGKAIQALEVMVKDGWVTASEDPHLLPAPEPIMQTVIPNHLPVDARNAL